jgi:hypothetical protein
MHDRASVALKRHEARVTEAATAFGLERHTRVAYACLFKAFALASLRLEFVPVDADDQLYFQLIARATELFATEEPPALDLAAAEGALRRFERLAEQLRWEPKRTRCRRYQPDEVALTLYILAARPHLDGLDALGEAFAFLFGSKKQCSDVGGRMCGEGFDARWRQVAERVGQRNLAAMARLLDCVPSGAPPPAARRAERYC